MRLHICGNTRHILREVGKLDADIVDIDFPVSMQQAGAETGPQQVLAGNLDPVREGRNGSPESIAESLSALRQQAGDRWIVAAGCEIVRDTPHRNLHALSQYAESHAPTSSPA